jgi:hypothetical protein
MIAEIIEIVKLISLITGIGLTIIFFGILFFSSNE